MRQNWASADCLFKDDQSVSGRNVDRFGRTLACFRGRKRLIEDGFSGAG